MYNAQGHTHTTNLANTQNTKIMHEAADIYIQDPKPLNHLFMVTLKTGM